MCKLSDIVTLQSNVSIKISRYDGCQEVLHSVPESQGTSSLPIMGPLSVVVVVVIVIVVQ